MATAAERLSQPAITNAVLSLESALGTRFFARLPRYVELMPNGHDVLHRPRCDAQTPFRAHSLCGTLHIAAVYTLLARFQPDLFMRFR